MFQVFDAHSNAEHLKKIENLQRSIADIKMSQSKEAKDSIDADAVSFILQLVIMDTESSVVEEELINDGIYHSILEFLESNAKDNGSLRLHYTISVSTLLMQLTLVSMDASDDNLRRSTSILRYTTWLLATSDFKEIEGQIAVAFIFSAGLVFALARSLNEVTSSLSNQAAKVFVEATAQFIGFVLNKLRS